MDRYCPLRAALAGLWRPTSRTAARRLNGPDDGARPLLADLLLLSLVHSAGRRQPHGGPVPNDQSLAPPAQPARPSPRRLLAWVLGALLLTGLFHCPALPHDGDHGHLPSLVLASGTAPEVESALQNESGHSHGGAFCTSPGLIPQVQGGPDSPTRAGALLPATAVPAVAAVGLFALQPRRRRHRIATPGRSTLTIVCRWRI